MLLAEFVECRQNDREDLTFVPILEAVMTGGLGKLLPLRQSVPLRSRTEDPEDAIQNFTVRAARSTTFGAFDRRGNQRSQNGPLVIV